MTEIIDRNGKRVTRSGALQDGDVLRVRMNMMDSHNPSLAAAAALAASVRSSEVFDMKIHGQTNRYGTTSDASISAREARIKRTEEEWKKPPKIGPLIKVAGKDVDTTGLSPAEARDARLADAWKDCPSVTTGDATAIEQVAVVGPSAPNEQLFAARDQAIANRDKRLEGAWAK